jgi:three-Cys-motif partner protein
MPEPRLDEVGYWSEIKLEILRKYAKAYTTILQRQAPIRGYLYIDGFAGAGVHISRDTGQFIPGSPLNALLVRPPFTEYHFIDLDGGRAESLRELAKGRENVFVHEGDCNTILMDRVFPRAQYSDYRRGLCLLDPYGLHLKWEVLQVAGQMQSIEVLVNFPLMDMNMDVLWRDPGRVGEAQAGRMDGFWGDRSWRDAAYKKTRGLFGTMEEKAGSLPIVRSFCERLKKVAGFAYVADPLPMRNSKAGVVYYLLFASPNKTGHGILTDIFNSYRNKGIA